MSYLNQKPLNLQNANPSKIRTPLKSPPSKLPKGSDEQHGIKEVWAENLEEEMLKLSKLLDTYKNISMDTEFPGFYKKNDTGTMDPYTLIKSNVDMLKLIQVGITLSDQNGNLPEGIHTWQFNLEFNLAIDKFTQESIELLQEAGINFNNMSNFGIKSLNFADNLTSSGLVLNPEVTWVTFHGAFDYAYLIKALTNEDLPQTQDQFMYLCKQFFPRTFDTKIIASEMEDIKGNSLQKLANELAIRRSGSQHQAGSDAHLTLLCYHGLCDRFDKKKIPISYLNRVFGLGQDAHIYNRSAKNFVVDSMNNYMYGNQQQHFYFPHANQNTQPMFNFNQMGMSHLDGSFFVPTMDSNNYFYYTGQTGQ